MPFLPPLFHKELRKQEQSAVAFPFKKRNYQIKRSRRSDQSQQSLFYESLEDRRLLHGADLVSPFNGASEVAVDVNVLAAFDFDADPATVNASTFELRDPEGALIPHHHITHNNTGLCEIAILTIGGCYTV